MIALSEAGASTLGSLGWRPPAGAFVVSSAAWLAVAMLAWRGRRWQ